MPPLLDSLTGDVEIASFFSDAADIGAMLAFEAALARAQAAEGAISDDAAAAIGKAISGFTPDYDSLADGLVRDGVVVPDLIRQLRAAVGEKHAQAVHLGATSQDAIDTSLVLRLAQVLPILDRRLDVLARDLKDLAERYDSVQLTAHTRMQRALPFTVPDKVATWHEPLLRHRQRLADIAPHLLRLQLGGPVGTRASFGRKGEAIAAHMAKQLHLSNARSWHSQRDTLADFAGLLSLLSGSLGKFGADVALMAQSEVGEVVLAGGGGSSSMAHKSNPVAAEALVTCARYNAGLAGIFHQALVHENERSGAAWTLEWLTLPKMVETGGASLRLATRLVGQIGFVDRDSRPV